MKWLIVLHEWQAAQDMSSDRTWYPSAQIFQDTLGAEFMIENMRKQDRPRFGHVTIRNIRGPFPWSEPSQSDAGVAK